MKKQELSNPTVWPDNQQVMTAKSSVFQPDERKTANE